MKSLVVLLLTCMLPTLCFSPGGRSLHAAVPRAGSGGYHETYGQVLTQAINRALAAELDGRMWLIDANSGPIMWYYQNLNGFFNQQTFNYISRRVNGSSGDLAQLTEAGGFPNAYSMVLQLLCYNISSADRARISAAEAASQGLADSTILLYESAFGTITPAQMAAAFAQYGLGASNKLDFVIDVVMGIFWSDRSTGGAHPLTYSQMATATNLDSLLPLMPPAGKPVTSMARRFMQSAMSIAGIVDSAQNAAWTLRQLKNNTQYPSGTNGGMQLVNPYDGSNAGYQVGYTVNNSLADLSRQLQDTSRKIRISITTHSTGGGYVNIIVSRGAGSTDTINYNLPDSMYVDADDSLLPQGTGPWDITLTALFSRYAVLNTGPAQWSDVTNTGWYFSYPINQALWNDTFDVTGYKFLLPSPYNMSSYDSGGTFGSLQQLLLCTDRPQVMVTMGSEAAFGTPTYSSFPVMVPQMQATAYVVGGVFVFPQGGR